MNLKSKAFWTGLFWLLSATVMGQNVCKVVSVTDGDTYKILKNGKIIILRLCNVDAPEMKQQYGTVAKQNVSAVILGKNVVVDSVGLDKYKRELVNIKVDGKRLDSLLIRNGWAWHYKQYSNDTMLEQCQQAAIAENKGLWVCGVGAVCPPSLFRKYNAKYRKIFCSGCNQ